MASWYGLTDTVRLLIEHNANINASTVHGDTPLIDAARNNNMASVCALVEAGADTTLRNKHKMTAAQRAAERGNHAIVEYLTRTIRFHSSTRDRKGQLHRIKGRSTRAIERDLKGNCLFVNHVLHRLRHFCMGKHR